MKKFKKEKQRTVKGITLISLVITIIILIILAGISINLVLGENGLFNRAKQAKEEYINAQIAEQEGINNLEKQIEELNKGLPQNTPEIEAGTEVQIPSKWLTTTSAYVQTETGEIVKKAVVASNVKAISTGNGEIVPVPEGFYYVGGTVSSGVVISDNVNDKNKYKDAENGNVPAGAIYNEDGSAKRIVYDDEGEVIIDEFTEEEKNTAILGNQFVWIPVTEENYKKISWGSKYQNATWETQTNLAELAQIKKYEGFYVGRYEAGTSEITISTGTSTVDFSIANTASSWENTNFSIRDDLSNHTVTGKITSKAGEIPYYHADYFTALKLCNKMYDTSYMYSGLVTGTMWDAIMNFIASEGTSIVTTESTWGNYNAPTEGVTFKLGKGRYATVNSSNGSMMSAFQPSDGNHYYAIRTTASTEGVKQKNLYDIAGNLWEWTQAAAYPNNTAECYMLRGGSFHFASSSYPACYRAYSTATSTDTSHGFRPALYIM